MKQPSINNAPWVVYDQQDSQRGSHPLFRWFPGSARLHPIDACARPPGRSKGGGLGWWPRTSNPGTIAESQLNHGWLWMVPAMVNHRISSNHSRNHGISTVRPRIGMGMGWHHVTHGCWLTSWPRQIDQHHRSNRIRSRSNIQHWAVLPQAAPRKTYDDG